MHADVGAGLECGSHHWDAGLWDWVPWWNKCIEKLLNLLRAHLCHFYTVIQKAATLPREKANTKEFKSFDILFLCEFSGTP